MKTLVIDGHNAAWRLAKRLPILTNDGKPIQVVFGMMTMMHGLLKQFQPDAAILCWDTDHSEYRKKIFPAYKANRRKWVNQQEEHAYKSANRQIEECKRIFRKLNMAQLYFPKTEGDDLIAMVCQEKKLNGRRLVISSDMDMLQLVNDDTDVWSPIKTELFTRGNFRQKIGLSSRQFLQLRAVTGDVSDNIPGIARGLGEMTVRELLASYKDMETLFTPEVEKKLYNRGNRYRLLYNEGAKQAYFRNLMLMDLSVSSYNHPEEKKVRAVVAEAVKARTKIDKTELKNYFISMRFHSLLKDFSKWITPFEELDTQ
jgi:DNA polymerase-1